MSKNMESETKKHWEEVYETKNASQVSWTQETPKTSLNFIKSFGLKKNAKIIDIGGGDSKLVDYLLDEGFENITVLDISAIALEKAKKRLGEKATKINWVVSDISEFKPNLMYSTSSPLSGRMVKIDFNDIGPISFTSSLSSLPSSSSSSPLVLLLSSSSLSSLLKSVALRSNVFAEIFSISSHRSFE